MLFDPGLQPERTALAWQRTLLSLLVAAVAGARVLGPVLGWWALLIGVVGAATVVWVAVLAGRRHDRSVRHLLGLARPGTQVETQTGVLPDGLHVALTAGLVLVAGVLGAGYVLWQELG